MDFSTTYGKRFTERARERLIVGLTLSLLVHGFILSLEFGIPGLGLPSPAAPWNERRAQTPEINIVLAPPPALVPAPVPAPDPALPPPPELPPIASNSEGLKLVPPRVAAPMPSPVKAKPAPARKTVPKRTQVKSQPKLITQTESHNDKFVVAPPNPDVPVESATSKVEMPNPPAEVAETPAPEKAPIKLEEPAPPVDTRTQLEQRRTEEETARQAKETEVKRQEEENAKRIAQEREVQRQAEEATKQREAALALQREQETANQRALELEQKRIAELKKLEEEKAAQEKLAQERAAREAVELAAHKQAEEETLRRTAELARQKQAEELTRQKQAEDLAAKAREQELSRQRVEEAVAKQRRIIEETGRAAAAAAARQSGAESRQGGTSSLSRNPYGSSDLASRALEQARRPDLLGMEPQRPRSNHPERSQRRSIFGSFDRDVGLTMYIKSWSLKIERNGNLNYSQLSKDRSRGDPVVTVAIRSDGSVEDVIIHRSSGRADLDDAVRRIVRLNARYAAFPPELARKYDVIEIRHIWNFDDTLRLIEEVR